MLWIIVFLLLLCSIAWILLNPPRGKEGFVTEPSSNQWTALRHFFHSQLSPLDEPQGIPIVGDYVPDGRQVDEAIETPGFFTPGISLFKRMMNTDDPNRAADIKCRMLSHPRLLQANRDGRTTDEMGALKGCGWWFVPDATVPSVAAYGQAQKDADIYGTALNPKDLPAGGEFIWDIAKAMEKEEIKRCKAITTCSLVTDGCGFCPSKSYSIPVDTAGGAKYTTVNDGNCGGGNIVTDPTRCPLIEIPVQDYLGDFDYDVNGNPILNDKYWRIKNAKATRIPDPCELENGRLSKDCRLRLVTDNAKGMEGKGLHRIISQEGNLTDVDRIALFYLKTDARIDLPEQLWLPTSASLPATETPLTKTEAQDLMERLNTAATSGPENRSRASALWFLNETPFNLCDYKDTEVDTFPLQCIQREFRKAGCQAAGSKYPTTDTEGRAFAGMTYGDIKTQFRDLYLKMQDTEVVKNVREQDDAIQQCLGIGVKRTADETYEMNPNLCREQGIEYWFTTIPTLSQRILYARRVFQDQRQLVPFEGNLGTEMAAFLGKKGAGTRGYTARTFVEVKESPITLQLDVPPAVKQFYSLWINRERMTPLTASAGTQYRVSLPNFRRSEVEVRFEGRGATLDWGAPRLSFTPNTPSTPLYLAQSWWKPFVSLRASRGGFGDENQLVIIDVGNKAMERKGGRWGLPLLGESIRSDPARGFWMSMARTVTLMVYWTAIGNQTVLWKLDQGNGGTNDAVAKLSVVNNQLVFTVQSGTSIFEVRSTTGIGAANRWMHVGVVMGSPLSGTRLYLDGVDVTNPSPLNTGTLRPEMTEFKRVVLGHVGFQGYLGWFHIYESVLGSKQMGRDLLYDDPGYSDKEYETRR